MANFHHGGISLQFQKAFYCMYKWQYGTRTVWFWTCKQYIFAAWTFIWKETCSLWWVGAWFVFSVLCTLFLLMSALLIFRGDAGSGCHHSWTEEAVKTCYNSRRNCTGKKKYTLKCIPSLGSCFSKSFVRSGLMKLCAPDTGAFLFTSEVVISCTARS